MLDIRDTRGRRQSPHPAPVAGDLPVRMGRLLQYKLRVALVRARARKAAERADCSDGSDSEGSAVPIAHPRVPVTVPINNQVFSEPPAAPCTPPPATAAPRRPSTRQVPATPTRGAVLSDVGVSPPRADPMFRAPWSQPLSPPLAPLTALPDDAGDMGAVTTSTSAAAEDTATTDGEIDEGLNAVEKQLSSRNDEESTGDLDTPDIVSSLASSSAASSSASTMTKNNDNKNIAVATPAAEEASGAEEQRPEEEEEEEGLTGSEAFVLNVTADDALGQVDLETGVDETAVGAGSDAAAAACGSMEGNAAEDGVALAALWDTLPDHLQAKVPCLPASPSRREVPAGALPTRAERSCEYLHSSRVFTIVDALLPCPALPCLSA